MGPIAERVRREAGLPVTSAWGFGTPQLAEGALQAGQLDLVSVGRAHLADHTGRTLRLKNWGSTRRPGHCLHPTLIGWSAIVKE